MPSTLKMERNTLIELTGVALKLVRLYLAPFIEAQDSHFQGNASATGGLPYGKVSLLTLTVKNCHFSQLRLQVRSMEQSWNRFHRSTVFPGMGFLKSLEITRPRDYFYYGRYIGRLGLSKAHQWYERLQQLDSWNPQQWRSHPAKKFTTSALSTSGTRLLQKGSRLIS
jgi:hypothetical protein